MLPSVWPSDSATLVLVPSGDEGESLLLLAAEWVRLGYLSHALWLRPEDVQINGEGPPLFPVMALGMGSNREVLQVQISLFDELARNRFDKLRLIVVRTVKAGVDHDSLQDRIAEVLTRYVEWSLPLPTPDQTKRQTKLMRMNLVCTPTEVAGGDQASTYEAEWDLNIVASAEDRSTPWSGDAFIRDDQRFPSFVLLHVATAGGLWNGLPASPFDNIPETRAGQIWMPRVFVSGVVTEGLARRVASRVLAQYSSMSDADTSLPVDVPIPGTVPIAPEQTDAWVDWMVQQSLSFDAGRLAYRDTQAYAEPPKGRLLEWQQVKSFFIFAGSTLAAMPRWVWRWIRKRIGRSMTSVFQGDRGQATVGIDQQDAMDLRDRELLRKFDELQSAYQNARKALLDPAKQVVDHRSTPELWSNLRRIVFGMLDGSDLTDLGVQRTENGLPVFSKAAQLLQDPRDVWEVPSGVELSVGNAITWRNLEMVSAFQRELTTETARLSTNKDALLQKLVDLRDAIEAKKSEIVEAEREVADAEVNEVDDAQTGSISQVSLGEEVEQSERRAGVSTATS